VSERKTENDTIPGWLPPLLYGVVTVVLFRAFIFGSGMLYGSDTEALGYMARAFFADAVLTEGFPLWNPQILGGTPFIESLAGGDSLYPLSAPLLFFLEPYRALGWKLVLHVFLAGIFTFAWIRALGLSRSAALLAGLAYSLAPFMVSLVFNGQDGKIFVTALTPLTFWATERFFTRQTSAAFAVLALVVGTVILTTHFQMAYFLFGGVGAYAVFRAIESARSEDGEAAVHPRRAFATFGTFLAAALLGAGISAVQLVPAADYVVESSRRTATTTAAGSGEAAAAYSSSWSLHPEEVVSLVVPEFVGVSTADADWAQGTYWGRNFFKSNHEYGGLVVLILAGLAFFGAPRRGLRWFFVGLGSVALLFALGTHTPVWRLFYEVLPGISLFRAPSLAIFLFGFSVVTLMAFGFDRLLSIAPGDDQGWKGPTRYGWVWLGILLLFFVSAASGGLSSFWSGTIWRDMPPESFQTLQSAQRFITRGLLVSVVLAGALVGLFAAVRSGKLPVRLTVGLVGILIVVDLYRVDEAFIRVSDFEAFDSAGHVIETIKAAETGEEPYRVFSFARSGQDVRPGQFGLELAGGHHPNDLARYRELIGMQGSGAPQNLLISPNVLDVLNVRWVIWPAWQWGAIEEALPATVVETLEPVTGTQLQGRPYEMLYRRAALPRARLVSRPVVLSDDEALPYLLSEAFDPAREVVLSDAPSLALGDSAVGEVSWITRLNNRQVLRVRSEEPALLVVADNWYPAWHAQVDGREVPVLRANHSLRAVEVDAGEHEIVFTYRSPILRFSLWTSLVSLVAVVGLAVAPPARRFRRGDAVAGSV
jgi:hypothetical protein